MNYEELVDKIAIDISGAPFPSNRAKAKARSAIATILETLKVPSKEMISDGYEAMMAWDARTGADLGIGDVYAAMPAASPLNPEKK